MMESQPSIAALTSVKVIIHAQKMDISCGGKITQDALLITTVNIIPTPILVHV